MEWIRESQGKPTVVDFFFAECAPCIAEVPVLNAYADKHPDMNFVAITFDDRKTAQAFVDKHHFEWPVAYGGTAYNRQLGISVFPTLLLVDANGRVLAHHSGSPVSFDGPESHAITQETQSAQLKWLDHWVTTHS